jgi:hypothetical protein
MFCRCLEPPPITSQHAIASDPRKCAALRRQALDLRQLIPDCTTVLRDRLVNKRTTPSESRWLPLGLWLSAIGMAQRHERSPHRQSRSSYFGKHTSYFGAHRAENGRSAATSHRSSQSRARQTHNKPKCCPDGFICTKPYPSVAHALSDRLNWCSHDLCCGIAAIVNPPTRCSTAQLYD